MRFVGVGNIHHIIINSHIARLDEMVALNCRKSRIEIPPSFCRWIFLHQSSPPTSLSSSLAYRYYIVRLFHQNLLFGIGLESSASSLPISQSSQLCPISSSSLMMAFSILSPLLVHHKDGTPPLHPQGFDSPRPLFPFKRSRMRSRYWC